MTSDAPKITLLVIRHAHRDVQNPRDDNSLSPRGHKQSKALSKAILERWGPSCPWTLISSPKLRCQETLECLAESLKTDVIIDPDLDEQSYNESNRDMTDRIDRFLTKILSKTDDEKPYFFALCSHGDWIPLFQELVMGQGEAISKADAFLFEKREAAPWHFQHLKLNSLEKYSG